MHFLRFGWVFSSVCPTGRSREQCREWQWRLPGQLTPHPGAHPSPGDTSAGKPHQARGTSASTPCLWPIFPIKTRRRNLWAGWSTLPPLPHHPHRTTSPGCLGFPSASLVKGDFKLHRVFWRPREPWQCPVYIPSCSQANIWYHNPLWIQCCRQCQRMQGFLVGFSVLGLHWGNTAHPIKSQNTFKWSQPLPPANKPDDSATSSEYLLQAKIGFPFVMINALKNVFLIPEV